MKRGRERRSAVEVGTVVAETIGGVEADFRYGEAAKAWLKNSIAAFAM
jgi:hypothetical protein